MPSKHIISHAEVEHLITAGSLLVIYKGDVLRLDEWQHSHPGGRLAIRHMVGRDATDEISIYHSEATLKNMYRFRIGTLNAPWDNLVPPIQRKPTPANRDRQQNSVATERYAIVDDKETEKSEVIQEMSKTLAAKDVMKTMIKEALDQDLRIYPAVDVKTQRVIEAKYKELHEKIQIEGYYKLSIHGYMADMARYATLFGLFVLCMHLQYYIVASCFLGLFWHQIMFTAHDAGHLGITHNFLMDTLIGIFIGNFCCGLSIGWWKSSHNVHHLVTNNPSHDPDIQNVPLFATSAEFFTSIRSTYYDGFCYVWDEFAAVAVRYQHLTYYPVMAVARFNLYFLSWAHLLSPKRNANGRERWVRPVEIFATSCYLFLFAYVLVYRNLPTWRTRILFTIISHVITMPLHVQITLSHWGTSTSDLGPTESFAQRQLRTTADVACPPWLDWIHGGLQFQSEHHLFPRVPRHNLRQIRPLVQKFCEDTEIPYLINGFVDGNVSMLGKLQDIANQASILSACSKHMATVWDDGTH